jgi:signal transduction histidine kinase
MEALLFERGDAGAALQLERYWNDLRPAHSFLLFCAYPMKACAGASLAEPLNGVCAAHSRVIPAESYSGLASADERLRTIIRLQQKGESLEAQIAERKEAEAALHKMKEELETQVADLRRLHEMSVGLTATLDVEPLLEEVLRSAMAMHGTEMGLLSLCEAGRDGLNVRVHSGFDERFLKMIEWVPAGGGACGTCYADRRRVIVEDVELDPVFADYREAARMAGFRACHSTPLLTRNGNIIGVLSVHFDRPHRPSERETRLMDLYARMAADIIENAQLHNRMQQELEERKQLLIREQEARAEAETANRMKDLFLSTVSHELRTPLNAIVGWTHMLRHSKLDEAMTSRGLETIERNARTQAQLVDDILDMSRVITGRLCLNVGSVDLADVINKAIDSAQLAADSKSIRLGVTMDPTARHLSGDAGRLQQAVWNLLSNAVKFTPSGGRVEVRLERNGSDAEIQVSDTGEGIRGEILPFIFDCFRQADGTSTRRHGGLGLGLAIVRHLMEMHGGMVEAESAGEGCGATFTLRLPLNSAQTSARIEGAGGGRF